MPGRLTAWKGQEVFIEALNLVNKELGYQSFEAVILGSDQGRDIYTKKIKRLAEQHRLTPQLKFESGKAVSHVLSNSFGFGGNNSTVILSKV